MSSIEDRLFRLEAIEDIKQLKADYCAHCDNHYDGAAIAEQFTPDGIWDGGKEFGRHEGRAAIRAYFEGISANITFAAHLVLNPIIEVTGPASARGRWRLIMPCTITEGGGSEARWLVSTYNETYANVDGRWLFRELVVRADLFAPHVGGWSS